MALTIDDKIKADISKIHGEINQLLNQRYNLIAVTMTLFGLFLGVLTQKDKFNFHIPIISSVFVLSFFFLILLCVLAYVTRNLTRQFYILRGYLQNQKYSIWEDHYSIFRTANNRYGYTKTQRKLYLILGSLVLLITFIDQFIGQSFEINDKDNFYGPTIYILTLIVYIWVIWKFTTKNSKSLNETSINTKWNFLQKEIISENTFSTVSSINDQFTSQIKDLKESFEKLKLQNDELNESKISLLFDINSTKAKLKETLENYQAIKTTNQNLYSDLKNINEEVSGIQKMNVEQKILIIDQLEKLKQQLT